MFKIYRKKIIRVKFNNFKNKEILNLIKFMKKKINYST